MKMASESVWLAKKALRKEIAQRLQRLSLEEIKRQSDVVCDKLFASKEFQESKRVSVYLSTNTELQTTSILTKLFATGRDCFVPRYSKTAMEMVRLHSIEDYDSLPETNWKIKQPALDEKRENALENGGLDIILCPGVAFTKTCSRLGHGGGYYDTYLRALFNEMKSRGQRPAVIGLALKEQIVESIPVTESDLKMDMVLFDDTE